VRWLRRFDAVSRIVSLRYMVIRRSLAWRVRVVIVTGQAIVKKQGRNKADSAPKMQRENSSAGKIVVYRGYFVRLLSVPKPLRDQLLIELPTLQALRTGEVSSLKAEYIDFERGDMLILDSKKNELATRPLSPVVASHLAEYMAKMNVSVGYLFLPRRRRKLGNKSVGASLTEWAILNRWAVWCGVAGVPVMNPRMGRAYFAVVEHYVLGKPLAYIQFMLRHDHLQSTEHYVHSRIVCYEDQKALFLQGKRSPFSSSQCVNSNGCLGAMPGCHCRMFQPLVSEVKKIG
jgi:integrase